MSKFMWILGATCLGVAAYVILSDQSYAPRYAEGYADEDLAEIGDDVGSWGTKKRAGGLGGVVGGKVKQGFGRITGDEELESEGLVDEAVGNVKDTAGKAAHAVSQTIADLNR